MRVIDNKTREHTVSYTNQIQLLHCKKSISWIYYHCILRWRSWIGGRDRAANQIQCHPFFVLRIISTTACVFCFLKVAIKPACYSLYRLPVFFMRAATTDRLYNVHAKHTSNSGFVRTFMPCSGCRTMSGVPNIAGWPTARSKLSVNL